MARLAICLPFAMSRTFSLTRSQARSFESMARLNSASSRTSCASWRRTRIAQISDHRSGAFCPVNFPLFHGVLCLPETFMGIPNCLWDTQLAPHAGNQCLRTSNQDPNSTQSGQHEVTTTNLTRTFPVRFGQEGSAKRCRIESGAAFVLARTDLTIGPMATVSA